MNVEFQIHGVLSSGQKTWKQEDQDYYKQFYSDQTEDVLMIVEIVNRPHGVSTYYNSDPAPDGRGRRGHERRDHPLARNLRERNFCRILILQGRQI